MKSTMGSESFFFQVGNNSLSGRIFAPLPKTANRKGFVFLYPFAGERIRVHRLDYYFALALVEQGYSVFQFDYRGCGDSSGRWQKNTIESYLKDTNGAIDFFTNMMELEQVGLFGLRFGATIASLISESDDRISMQIFWDPVVNMKEYLYEALRVNLGAQVSAYREIRCSRKDLIAQMINGKQVNLDGYELSDIFYSGAEKINLLDHEKSFSGNLIVIDIVSPKKPLKVSGDSQKLLDTYRQCGSHTKLDVAHSEQFWSLLRNYYPISEDLFNKTINLLGEK